MYQRYVLEEGGEEYERWQCRPHTTDEENEAYRVVLIDEGFIIEGEQYCDNSIYMQVSAILIGLVSLMSF